MIIKAQYARDTCCLLTHTQTHIHVYSPHVSTQRAALLAGRRHKAREKIISAILILVASLTHSHPHTLTYTLSGTRV